MTKNSAWCVIALLVMVVFYSCFLAGEQVERYRIARELAGALEKGVDKDNAFDEGTRRALRPTQRLLFDLAK